MHGTVPHPREIGSLLLRRRRNRRRCQALGHTVQANVRLQRAVIHPRATHTITVRTGQMAAPAHDDVASDLRQ